MAEIEGEELERFNAWHAERDRQKQAAANTRAKRVSERDSLLKPYQDKFNLRMEVPGAKYSKVLRPIVAEMTNALKKQLVKDPEIPRCW